MIVPPSNVVQLKPDAFEEFWAVYPRKTAKLAAKILWEQITGAGREVKIEGETVTLKATPDEIMTGALSYRYDSLDMDKDAERFIPHARTWLYQGRFLDADEDKATMMRRILERCK